MRIVSCTIGLIAVGVFVPAVIAQSVSIENEEPVVFRHVLGNDPIVFDMMPDQEITEAVREFHQSARNPYIGQESAVQQGKEIYSEICQSCHLPSGKGGMGPSLVDDQWAHQQHTGQKGMFEITYAGGAGAMQAFGDRYSQDEILKVLAYIEKLRSEKSE